MDFKQAGLVSIYFENSIRLRKQLNKLRDITRPEDAWLWYTNLIFQTI